jgi:hypothetical protein
MKTNLIKFLIHTHYLRGIAAAGGVLTRLFVALPILSYYLQNALKMNGIYKKKVESLVTFWLHNNLLKTIGLYFNPTTTEFLDLDFIPLGLYLYFVDIP